MDILLQWLRRLAAVVRPRVQPIRKLLVEYCDNSTIHGVRYLTERLLHWSERLWWIIALGASLGLCGSAAVNIWTEWRDNPMAYSFSEPPTSVSEIPFPTITICPEIKSRKAEFDLTAALKSLSNLTRLKRNRLNALAHISPRLHGFVDDKENFADESIYQSIAEVALRYDDVISALSDRLFTKNGRYVPVITEEGVCFSFNGLNSHDTYTDEMAPEILITKENVNASNWSLERDFRNKSTAVRYPIHDVRGGSESGLITYLLIQKENIEQQSKGTDQAFKVVFSVPGDALKFSENTFRMVFEESVLIFIKPKLTITSDGLRKYDPHQRQCFFDSERRLRFFKIYSQRNCEAECLANFTNAKCGCVKFSQPRDRRTKVCGAAKIYCYKKAEDMLSSGDSSTKSLRDRCDCLPSCISIEYEADIEQTTLNTEKIKNAISYIRHITFSSVVPTQFSTALKDDQVKVLKRIESNTWSDFLAFCGGLLGIFLGISALSIVEIIYFLTIRLYWIIRPLEGSNAVIPFHQTTSNIFDRFRFLRGIRAFVVEFCDNSNIHGVVYFTRRGLHWTERFWWIISFGLSLWLCTSMSMNVWQGWQENPVKMTFTLKERPISDIPFPTVTICPEMKTMKHKLTLTGLIAKSRSIADGFKALIDNKEFWPLFHICLQMMRNTDMTLMEKKFPPIVDENIYDILQDVAPQFDDVMHKCIWQGEVVDCSKFMAPILTENGLCFNFNALNSHEIYTDEMAPKSIIVTNNSNTTNWSLEKGYKIDISVKDYPFRVSDSGRGAAFEISLDFNERNFDYFCGDADDGFRVILSAPGDKPQFSNNFFKVPLLDESVITINPKLTTTSDGLRKYNPNHRKCFFDSERKLRFYKTYTQTSCEEECFANYTKSECGCVKFSQPRDKDTPICGVGKIPCYLLANAILELHLRTGEQFRSAQEHFKACNCLPSCTTIEYNPVIDRVKFDKAAIAVTAARNVNVSGIYRAKLMIYFEDRLFETEQRHELYTIVDLIAICGGLLGLFMGISVLSIVEIIYYSSLRWYWILRRPASETN